MNANNSISTSNGPEWKTAKEVDMIPASNVDAGAPLLTVHSSDRKSMEKITRAASYETLALAENFITPRKILKVGRVTVVFWNDYTSTAVRCGENEILDDYTAFCAALGKKIFGCNSALKRAFMDAPTETREA